MPAYKDEKDPSGKGQHEPGTKLDAGKAPVFRGVLQYFPRALKAVANVSMVGAQKYTWKGWESVPEGESRYGDALGRHMMDEAIEGEVDTASGLLHSAQIAWNALARLELMLRRKEDEPTFKRLADNEELFVPKGYGDSHDLPRLTPEELWGDDCGSCDPYEDDPARI